ncbi:hypothetical protein [Azospirillum sp. A23]
MSQASAVIAVMATPMASWIEKGLSIQTSASVASRMRDREGAA